MGMRMLDEETCLRRTEWWTVVLWVLSFVAAVRVAYKDLLSVCDRKVKASVSIDTDWSALCNLGLSHCYQLG